MRELSKDETKAFIIVDRLSYNGEDSIIILRDLLKILILSDEFEYIEKKLIEMYPHLIREDLVDTYQEDRKITNMKVFKEWERNYEW